MNPINSHPILSLLFFCALFAMCFCYSRRFEIRFRWHFGMRQSERGAERMVRKVFSSHVRNLVSAIEQRSMAKKEFDNCDNLTDVIRSKRRAMQKAESEVRALERKYKTLCELASAFGMGREVKDAEEEFRRGKVWMVK